MEQKTEASQSVDAPMPSGVEKMTKQELWNWFSRSQRAAAEKKYLEEKFFTVTTGLHSARLCGNPYEIIEIQRKRMAGLEMQMAQMQKGYERKLEKALKAQPAPTEAPKGPLEIPEPGNSNSLADRIFRLPCNWKGDHRLSAAIEMGHAMACEQAYDLAYEHAAQSPTEAAHGALSTNPNLTTSGVTCQPVAAQGNTSNNSSSSQLSGNSGELVQGEDSARLADGYKSSTMVSDFYGPKVTLHYETTAQADAAHDTLVSMIEQASAETGGVKP